METEFGETIECKARGKFRKEHIIPIVGDEAEIEIINGKGSITKIYPRRNSLIRPAVANIDMIVVVTAAKSPEPSAFLIDKMLFNAESHGIKPILCINKSDLAETEEFASIYKKAGYSVLTVSAYRNEGLSELFELIKGKTVAFAGPSGVGKSTILSKIIGEKLETGAVSEKISRGKHTTRHVELFKINGGGYVFDTPGFSSVEPENMELSEIAMYFPEMRELYGECRFRGCMHIGEPNCAVKGKVLSGEISQSRYNSYKELYEIQKGKKIWK